MEKTRTLAGSEGGSGSLSLLGDFVQTVAEVVILH